MIKKDLTKAEEQIMKILWKIKKGFVKDIISHFKMPKPAYNTVSTIVRILERKNFVSHKVYGKTHEYFPLIEKKDYTKNFLSKFIGNYFDNSFGQLLSFFSRENDLNVKELEELMKLVEKEIKLKKNNKNV